MKRSDRELIARVRQRDAAAFDLLFRRYQKAIRRHLAGIVRDRSSAEDLLQEVFLRVWTRAGQWRGQGTARAWLFRIATNLALNHLRASRRRREQPLEPAAAASEEEEDAIPNWMADTASLTPHEILEKVERTERLGQLMDGLHEDRREVLRLVYEEEMTIQEAAETLRVPEGTVKSRLHYARKRLAQKWKEEGR